MDFENMNIEMNEEMTTDLVELDNVEVEPEEDSGLSTLAAMAIGAGVTIAVAGVVKLAKKGINKLKLKKENPETAETEKGKPVEAEYKEINEVGEDA